MILMAMNNKLFLLPLDRDKIQKVVDIGTGTGPWAIDFADQFPNVEVLGTDITPIQPNWVPPNVSFVIDDANQDWAWPENTIDFIHNRFLSGCILDWKRLYREAYRCVKPGGWLEHQDVGPKWFSNTGGINEDSPIGQMSKLFPIAGDKSCRSFNMLSDLQTKA